MLHRIISLVLIFGLLFQQVGFAQVAAEFNIGGYLSSISSNTVQDKFRPLHLRYFSYDNLNDNFKVLLDKGDINNLGAPELESSTKTLLSYFLVGVVLPDSMFWVNLRPDSEDQIIDQYLEKTDVGKIMLEADLQLKKDTALFTSPQTPEGKKYWDKLYKKAAELYGYDNVTIPTLTRPWIVPGEIIVRESKDSAYVYKATLKVMLEQDYLKDSATYSFKDGRSRALNEYSSQLIRELIIPRLTREVNSSKRYAPLRQVYYSLILSRWFKLRFTGKTGTYASCINTKDITNLISKNPWSKTDYFNQYKKSFSEGEYNIKEPVYTPTGQVIRSYFSGGINVAGSAINTQNGIILSSDNANKLGDLIGGKAVIDPRSVNFYPIIASSPIDNKSSIREQLDKEMKFVRWVSLNSRNPNIPNAVKFIAEQGDDNLKQEVVNIMFELATSHIPVDWDHFDQIPDHQEQGLEREKEDALFAIKMIQLIGGNIAVAKLKELSGSRLLSKEIKLNILEAIQTLQDETALFDFLSSEKGKLIVAVLQNKGISQDEISGYTTLRKFKILVSEKLPVSVDSPIDQLHQVYADTFVNTMLHLTQIDNQKDYLDKTKGILINALDSINGNYAYAFSELIDFVIDKLDLKSKNSLVYQEFQKAKEKMILKAFDYYYGEILRHLPSPNEFEDDLKKLKPNLFNLLKDFERYRTNKYTIDQPTLLHPDSLAEDVQDFMCEVYYMLGGIWIKNAWRMPGGKGGAEYEVLQISQLENLVSYQGLGLLGIKVSDLPEKYKEIEIPEKIKNIRKSKRLSLEIRQAEQGALQDFLNSPEGKAILNELLKLGITEEEISKYSNFDEFKVFAFKKLFGSSSSPLNIVEFEQECNATISNLFALLDDTYWITEIPNTNKQYRKRTDFYLRIESAFKAIKQANDVLSKYVILRKNTNFNEAIALIISTKEILAGLIYLSELEVYEGKYFKADQHIPAGYYTEISGDNLIKSLNAAAKLILNKFYKQLSSRDLLSMIHQDTSDHSYIVKNALEEVILEKFKAEQQSINIYNYLNEINAKEDIEEAQKKYSRKNEPQKFRGVTIISNAQLDKSSNKPSYHIFRALLSEISKWDEENKLNDGSIIIATPPAGSEHITLYDLICDAEVGNGISSGKYFDQLLPGIQSEINVFKNELIKSKEFMDDTEALRYATYKIVAEKVWAAVSRAGFDNHPGISFKPSHISVFMPNNAQVLILSMEPSNLRTLENINRLQNIVYNATGIKNFWDFKSHITLGYIVSRLDTPGKKDKFRELINSLENIIQQYKSARNKDLEFPITDIELSAFSNMGDYRSLGIFPGNYGPLVNNQFDLVQLNNIFGLNFISSSPIEDHNSSSASSAVQADTVNLGTKAQHDRSVASPISWSISWIDPSCLPDNKFEFYRKLDYMLQRELKVVQRRNIVKSEYFLSFEISGMRINGYDNSVKCELDIAYGQVNSCRLYLGRNYVASIYVDGNLTPLNIEDGVRDAREAALKEIEFYSGGKVVNNLSELKILEYDSDGIPYNADMLGFEGYIEITSFVKAAVAGIGIRIEISEEQYKLNMSVNSFLDLVERLARAYLGATQGVSSSPVISLPLNEMNPGGIDFRALPMTIQPMGSFSGLNFNLPQLSQVELGNINVDSEIRQIKNMIQSGIIPSGQRIKELVAACMQKKVMSSRVDNLLLCLVDIFKLEEENTIESSPELREVLAIIDSQS